MKALKQRFGGLVRSRPSKVGPILRIALAVAIWPHGAQKLLGWFGGPGFEGAMAQLTGFFGLPELIAFLVIAIEFFGPIALALGFLSRVAAAGVAAVMVGAVATTHWTNGFFMNWTGGQAGEGFEYHVLAVAIALAVMVMGSGVLSVDRRLATASEAS